MKQSLWILLVAAIYTTSTSCQVVKRDGLTVSIRAEAIETDSGFVYTYVVANSASSAQRLEVVRVETGFTEPETENGFGFVTNPPGWRGWYSDVVGSPRDSTATGTVVWVATDSLANLSYLMQPSRSSLPPGSMVRFSLAANALPSAKRFWARGWARPLFEREYDSLISLGLSPKDIQRPWYEDSFTGFTIGPQDMRDTREAKSVLDTLVSYAHQSRSLGWIKNDGLTTGLDQKLANVRRLLTDGKIKPALNILEAFVKEVEAQNGKGLTSEAYALLKYNAEYLIGKLKEGER